MAQKDIKNRIASVKNIQKITRAMQMVAAARLRRAEQRIEQLRPYAAAIRRMTRQAAEAAGHIPRLPILTERPEQRSVGLLLVTGDRGLAGAFNSQILRAGLRAAREHQEAGRTPSYYASGKRGTSSLLFRGLELRGRYTGFTDRPAYANAREIAEDLMTAYIDGKLDSVEIVYNHYISPLSQVVRRETLLPLQQATILESDESAAAVRPTPSTSGGSPSARPAPQSRALASSGNEQDAGGRGLRPRHRSLRSLGGGEPPVVQEAESHALVEYEPGAEAILHRLIPDYVEISVFRALLESTASEHGARMTAMRNASENAGELIDDYTLAMNRARQAEITQEIMEVVAGAEALG